jgi:integrase
MSPNKQPSRTETIQQMANQSEAYRNFIDSINSEASRYEYAKNIRYFLDFTGAGDYDSLLEIDQQQIETKIRDYIVYLRQTKRLAPATVSNYVSPIVHFFEMNNCILNWKRLKKFKAKHRPVVEDKAYTREQIKKLVEVAPLRDKAIILLMASSGMRRGAVPVIRLRDIERVEKYGILKFRVYTNEQENYITYCTPECSRLIDQYLKWRERLGEKFTQDTPLFRVLFDTVTEVNRPKAVTADSVGKMVSKLLEHTGTRVPNELARRTELMQCHGLKIQDCQYKRRRASSLFRIFNGSSLRPYKIVLQTNWSRITRGERQSLWLCGRN